MKSFFLSACVLCTAGLMTAGTIVVSGDSSPFGGVSPIPAPNQQFLKNLLGSGTSVLIQEFDAGLTEGPVVATYFNTLAGVSATETTSGVSSLSGVNLFISILPQAAYSSTQITAMSNFLNGGGTLLLIGESTGYGGGSIADPILTTTLGLLGSSMTVTGNDGSVYPVTAATVANSLTTGVTDFQYGFTAFVSGGTPLFDTAPGIPFIESQSIGSSATTPEPASAALMIAGLFGIVLMARRRRAS